MNRYGPIVPSSSRTSTYRKGSETRQRLIEVALDRFGVAGFQATTTREIAQAAGVTLPVLAYHFGSKEGLYLACAGEIVARWRSQMEGSALAIAAELPELTSETARDRLTTLMIESAEALADGGGVNRWLGFIQHEAIDRGPAFDLFYKEIWAPGVELVAALIARIGTPDPRLEAVLLLSSLTAFSLWQPLTLRHFRWATLSEAALARVRLVVARQVRCLG